MIPRKGRPGVARQHVQRARTFRKLVKWRTGSEGRISYLKRGYGWRRTLNDGAAGASTWCARGVLAHNATQILRVIDTRPADTATRPSSTAPRTPRSTGPPEQRTTPISA